MTEAELLDALRAGLSSEPSATRPAGIEVRQDLAPAGGMPVWPPSYEGRLEIHSRYVDADDTEATPVIELDSVGSAANRLEEVLLELLDAERYPLPVSSTTVSPSNGDPRTITTLEAPHRLTDAWIRLSTGDDAGTTFERSDLGQEISLAHPSALDTILETSAHDLLLGVWDSHRKGPNGQLRIARSLTTTLIGLNPIPQAQFAARRDPLNLGEASDLPKDAKKLSEQGLSSIPPQKQAPWQEGDKPADRDNQRGGVAITSARYLGFLSFASLRRLGFTRYDAVEVRVMLAALALYALTLRDAAGWDLRARCSLVAQDDMRFTLVLPKGERMEFVFSVDAAERLFAAAVERVGINDRSVALDAGPTLTKLVEKSISDSQAS
jgi:CRISPR-associated protein Csb1